MKNLNILVLDDEQRIIDEISEFLVSRRYKVFSALRPSEAFGILKKQKIDIVILDIKLPEMDGLQVLEKIKSDYPTEIEVIMVSGHGDMSTVIDAMRKGATDYFAKPFRLIDINNAIMRTQRFVELNNKLKSATSDLKLLSNKLSEQIGCQLLGNSSVMSNMVNMMDRIQHSHQIIGYHSTIGTVVKLDISRLIHKNSFFIASGNKKITQNRFFRIHNVRHISLNLIRLFIVQRTLSGNLFLEIVPIVVSLFGQTQLFNQ